MRPEELLEAEYKQIIEPLGAIPTTEYVQIMLYYARAVIGSWRWPHSTHVLYVPPMKSRGIELVQIIQVVSAVSSSEDVYFVLITIGGVHVAWTWWLSCKFVVEPLELLQIKDVHVVGGKWPLAKPPTDDVQTISY